ncbi:MAG: hypothetical protein ABSF61_10390 [Anaerolineales bacterium]|jgi:hypothetical protein
MEILPDHTVCPWLSLDHHLEILRATWEQRPQQLYLRTLEPVLICAAEEGELQGLERKRRAVAAEEGLPRCPVASFPPRDHDIPVHRPRELADLLLKSVREEVWS